MTTATKIFPPVWRWLRFLLTPEDSSAAPGMSPAWATAWCFRAKILGWLAAGVGISLMLGRL